MAKKSVCIAAAFLAVFCLVVSLVCAEGTAGEDPKAKLREVRMKKAVAKNEYNAELAKITKEADEKLTKIKADFHDAREECLADKKTRCDRLNENYKNKMHPIVEEEKRLMEVVGASVGANFAKPRGACRK